MGYEFEEIEVRLDKNGPDRLQWVEVKVRLRDSSIGTINSVMIQVLVPADSDASFREVKQLAADQAVGLVEAALETLRSRPVNELQAAQWEREEAQRAGLPAWRPPGITEKTDENKS